MYGLAFLLSNALTMLVLPYEHACSRAVTSFASTASTRGRSTARHSATLASSCAITASISGVLRLNRFGSSMISGLGPVGAGAVPGAGSMAGVGMGVAILAMAHIVIATAWTGRASVH